MKNPNVSSSRESGFTLVEVAVALAILGWVLGSAIYLVKQYADERIRMREQFYSSQVAWNRLMEQYQDSRQWVPQTQKSRRENSGIETQAGMDWRWEIEVESAVGRDLFRYEAKVGPEPLDKHRAALSVYLVVKPSL